jgi:hypothetical protein
MSISVNFPTVRPSLLLDFANTEVLDPRITFSRPTTASYYDGRTSVVAEQNLLLQSQALGTSPWVNSGNLNTVTLNSTTAPDGTTTATTIQWGANLAQYTPSSQPALTANQYTASCYLKANTDTSATLSFVRDASVLGSACTFNLSAGTAGSVTNYGGTTGTVATITSVGSGWYRCALTVTASAASTWYVSIVGITSGNSIYAWGAQLEQRSTVTAYTPTTTTAITNYIPVLQTASSNTARFDHNPITRESLGLLIEEQRTNLLTYSEQFNDASWTKLNSNITVSGNTTISPDGTLSADTATISTGGTDSRLVKNVIIANDSSAYTASFYVKKVSTETEFRFDLRMSGGTTTLNYAMSFSWSTLIISSVTGANAPSSTSVTSVGNSWYRVSVVGANNSTGNTVVGLSIYPSTTNIGTTTGTGSLFIWGAQLEAGSFATSYIPTVASQVTRSADSASMTGTNFSSWYSQGQGSFYSEAKCNGITTAAFVGYVYSDVNNYIDVGRYQSTLYSNIVSSGATQAALNTGVSTATSNKFAVAFNTNDFAASANAGTVQTDTSGSVPYANAMLIGYSTVSGPALYYLNGTIKKLAYYPIRVTNAQLQGLTG